ncbi:MAG: C39 family peptidase [Oscillospiraceae bacterium]|jgi:hypothetical protein|nr:C39 family peptidase [Oscillospiraceae bacterium]MBR4347020.1 C39 family peptidase [Oscillospiraceae bacterium]
MRLLQGVLIVICSFAILLSAGFTVHAENDNIGISKLYYDISNEIVAKNVDRNTECFLFGQNDVTYDYEEAIGLYSNSMIFDASKKKSDPTALLVPIKSKDSGFIAYAKLWKDKGEYRIVTTVQGEYYNELYETINSDNFKTYALTAENIYLCDDSSLNDLGFYIEKEDCSKEYLDYTALYNAKVYISSKAIGKDMLVRDEDIYSYLEKKSTNRMDDFKCIDSTSPEAEENSQISVNTVAVDEFLLTIEDEGIHDEIEQMLTSSETPALIYKIINQTTLMPEQSITDTDSYILYPGEGFFYNVSISFAGVLSGDEYVGVGISGATLRPYKTPGTYSNAVYVDSNGLYSFKIKNNTSKTVTVDAVYYVLYFNYGGQDYYLNVPLHDQDKTLWCWAACTQMIAEYYGYNKSQTQIVQYTHGNTENEKASESDYPIAMRYATNNNYSAVKETNTTYTIEQLKNFIFSNRCTMLSMGVYENYVYKGRHAVVLTAVDASMVFVKVNDPSNGGSVKCHDYAVLIYPPNAPDYETYAGTIRVFPYTS